MSPIGQYLGLLKCGESGSSLLKKPHDILMCFSVFSDVQAVARFLNLLHMVDFVHQHKELNVVHSGPSQCCCIPLLTSCGESWCSVLQGQQEAIANGSTHVNT
jgi:hypothetical protein